MVTNREPFAPSGTPESSSVRVREPSNQEFLGGAIVNYRPRSKAAIRTDNRAPKLLMALPRGVWLPVMAKIRSL
jgi:hypothetical protein